MEDKYAPCSTETHAMVLSWECPGHLELLLSRAWAGVQAAEQSRVLCGPFGSSMPLAKPPGDCEMDIWGSRQCLEFEEDWKQHLPVWKMMGRRELVRTHCSQPC